MVLCLNLHTSDWGGGRGGGALCVDSKEWGMKGIELIHYGDRTNSNGIKRQEGRVDATLGFFSAAVGVRSHNQP